MSFTTTVAAAEDGLLAQLVPRMAALAPAVPVRLGDPGAHTLGEHVFIADEVRTLQAWELTGPLSPPRQESFTLMVKVMAKRSGGGTEPEYLALRDRVNDITEAVELSVHDDLTLSGAVWTCRVAAYDRSGGNDDDGRFLDVALGVECVSYLS